VPVVPVGTRTLSGLVGTLAVGALAAGCGGGGGSVASGELSAGDRRAVEATLLELRSTAIPTALVQATAVAAAAPDVCRIRLESSDPRTFRVFLFWTPQKIEDPILGAGEATYTWFDATLGEGIAQSEFHLGHANARLPRAQVLNKHAGDVFSGPGERCVLLTSGNLRLLNKPG
jgi:hypothetical protein